MLKQRHHLDVAKAVLGSQSWLLVRLMIDGDDRANTCFAAIVTNEFNSLLLSAITMIN